MLREALVKIVGYQAEQAVRIELAKDGSGVGGGWNFFVSRPTDRLHSCTMRTRGDEARRYCTSFDRARRPVLKRTRTLPGGERHLAQSQGL
jgi:hypothetical protein